MKTLLKNAKVFNVFNDKFENEDILIEDEIIIGIGKYEEVDSAKVIDLDSRYVIPGLIDSHIHIESTFLTPQEFARLAVCHGTTTVIADPHEIANVCGIEGIKYMIDSSKNLPLDILYTASSCVPATRFDESYKALNKEELKEVLSNPRVVGLAEVMNYVGVVNEDKDLLAKLHEALALGKVCDGHAPTLSGQALDKYISKGITSDHECTTYEEAYEKLRKGQFIMLREGTASKNLEALIRLLDNQTSNRCTLCCDDKDAYDLKNDGHIDSIIRKGLSLNAPISALLRASSFNACQRFNIRNLGALAPGYIADFCVLDDIDEFEIKDVYKKGRLVVKNKKLVEEFDLKAIKAPKSVTSTINTKDVTAGSFEIIPESNLCHVIEVVPKSLLTNDLVLNLDFSQNNGINVEDDILKLAVIERHNATGHMMVGYIKGIGLKSGAIASTVSHDSHNIIIIGTNDLDMYNAYLEIKRIGGGNVFVRNEKLEAAVELKLAGLMSLKSAEELIFELNVLNKKLKPYLKSTDVAPFMNMAFISLPVIPNIKMTTKALVDVNKFEEIELFVKE